MTVVFSQPLPTHYPEEQREFLLQHFQRLQKLFERLYELWNELCFKESEHLFRYPAGYCRELEHLCLRAAFHLEHTVNPHEHIERIAVAFNQYYYGRYLSLGVIANRIFHEGGFTFDNIESCHEWWFREAHSSTITEIEFGQADVVALNADTRHQRFMSLFLLNNLVADPSYRNFTDMVTPEVVSVEDLCAEEIARLDEEIRLEEAQALQDNSGPESATAQNPLEPMEPGTESVAEPAAEPAADHQAEHPEEHVTAPVDVLPVPERSSSPQNELPADSAADSVMELAKKLVAQQLANQEVAEADPPSVLDELSHRVVLDPRKVLYGENESFDDEEPEEEDDGRYSRAETLRADDIYPSDILMVRSFSPITYPIVGHINTTNNVGAALGSNPGTVVEQLLARERNRARNVDGESGTDDDSGDEVEAQRQEYVPFSDGDFRRFEHVFFCRCGELLENGIYEMEDGTSVYDYHFDMQ